MATADDNGVSGAVSETEQQRLKLKRQKLKLVCNGMKPLGRALQKYCKNRD
jgi:hypothetical protein